jgi:hypothetical protein
MSAVGGVVRVPPSHARHHHGNPLQYCNIAMVMALMAAAINGCPLTPPRLRSLPTGISIQLELRRHCAGCRAGTLSDVVVVERKVVL